MNKEKIAHRNRFRMALRQLQSALKAKGIAVYGMKQNTMVKLFANMTEQEIPKNVSFKKWLVELWDSRNSDVIFRIDTSFYAKPEWLELRGKIFAMYGRKCACCGDDDHLAIDHIKPRSLYPELELDLDNLQVLCRPCNSRKSNKIIVDYR